MVRVPKAVVLDRRRGASTVISRGIRLPYALRRPQRSEASWRRREPSTPSVRQAARSAPVLVSPPRTTESTITSWLRRITPVCPLVGEPCLLEMLEVAVRARARTTRKRIKERAREARAALVTARTVRLEFALRPSTRGSVTRKAVAMITHPRPWRRRRSLRPPRTRTKTKEKVKVERARISRRAAGFPQGGRRPASSAPSETLLLFRLIARMGRTLPTQSEVRLVRSGRSKGWRSSARPSLRRPRPVRAATLRSRECILEKPCRWLACLTRGPAALGFVKKRSWSCSLSASRG